MREYRGWELEGGSGAQLKDGELAGETGAK